jgi:hypothetical protein
VPFDRNDPRVGLDRIATVTFIEPEHGMLHQDSIKLVEAGSEIQKTAGKYYNSSPVRQWVPTP